MEVIEMDDNAKCFIKINKGYYEEITYKELKERRRKDNTYKNKKFIYIHKMLMEVSQEEYIDYFQEIERNRYAEKILKNFSDISIEQQKRVNEDAQLLETAKDNAKVILEQFFEAWLKNYYSDYTLEVM